MSLLLLLRRDKSFGIRLLGWMRVTGFFPFISLCDTHFFVSSSFRLFLFSYSVLSSVHVRSRRNCADNNAATVNNRWALHCFSVECICLICLLFSRERFELQQEMNKFQCSHTYGNESVHLFFSHWIHVCVPKTSKCGSKIQPKKGKRAKKNICQEQITACVM